MTTHWWMVRAEGGALIDAFEERAVVALGWDVVPDLSAATSREAVRQMYVKAYPEHGTGKQTSAVAMLFKFRNHVNLGDRVVTYDPEHRQYLVGDVSSEYLFDAKPIPHYPHLRQVQWVGTVNDYTTNKRRSLRVLTLRLAKHLTPSFARRRLLTITTIDVRGYTATRQAEGASNASINRDLIILKRMCMLAMQAGKLMVRPARPARSRSRGSCGACSTIS